MLLMALRKKELKKERIQKQPKYSVKEKAS